MRDFVCAEDEKTCCFLHYLGRIYKVRIQCSSGIRKTLNAKLISNPELQKQLKLGIFEYLVRETVDAHAPATIEFSTSLLNFSVLREKSKHMRTVTFLHQGSSLGRLPFRYTVIISMKCERFNAPLVRKADSPIPRGPIGSKMIQGIKVTSPAKKKAISVSKLLQLRSKPRKSSEKPETTERDITKEAETPSEDENSEESDFEGIQPEKNKSRYSLRSLDSNESREDDINEEQSEESDESK